MTKLISHVRWVNTCVKHFLGWYELVRVAKESTMRWSCSLRTPNHFGACPPQKLNEHSTLTLLQPQRASWFRAVCPFGCCDVMLDHILRWNVLNVRHPSGLHLKMPARHCLPDCSKFGPVRSERRYKESGATWCNEDSARQSLDSTDNRWRRRAVWIVWICITVLLHPDYTY